MLNLSLIKYILVLLFVVPLYSTYAQQSKIDSLTYLLKTAKADTAKVNTLNALSRQLWQKASYAEANKYANDALTLAETINFNTGKIYANISLGIIYTIKGNYPEALKKLSSALKTSLISNFKSGLADSYNAIAAVYNNQGNYPEALKNLSAYNKIQQQVGDKRGVANSYNNIGLIYAAQGNYINALENHFASLKIKEQIGDKRGIATSLGNIALVYERQRNYEEALKKNYASLKIKEEIGDKLGVANTYNNIGSIFLHLDNFPEAFKNCFVSLKINEEIGAKNGIAYSYNSIGLIYEKQKNHNDALKNHFASLKIREEMGDKKGIACSFVNIGDSYVNLKNYSEARRFLIQALSLSEKIGSKEDIIKSYSVLARLDSATGNWKGAYQNDKLANIYRDSIVDAINSKKIVQAQMQYEFNKKEDSLKYKQALTNEELKQQTLLTQQQQQALLLNEKEFELISNGKKLQQFEIDKNRAAYALQKAEGDKQQAQLILLHKEQALQTLELKKQKALQNYFIAGIVLFSILTFFIYSNYSTRQKLKLQTLRNKIASDLHDDVGSTLSSISIFSQMAQQQSKEVIPLLETIEESSRKMLDAMGDIVWTINPENDQFEKIILRMRSFAYELLGAKKIDFEFIADDELIKLKLLMNVRKNLYLIFKEATNNIAKYSGADKASFTIKGEKNILTMLINDNGKGFNINKLSEGNGLKNMKRRAEEIGGKLIINSNPGNGTSVQLNVVV